MTTTPRVLPALILATLGGLLLPGPALAATPMVGCLASLLMVADQTGEPQPDRHELMMAVTRLPDYIPLLTTKRGYDYCVFYQRAQMDDAALPVNTGRVSMAAYRLSNRGKWRRLVRLSNVPVEDNVAVGCKNSTKRLEVGTALRWVVEFDGLPPLDFFDMYEIETVLVTGGMGEALEDAGARALTALGRSLGR